MLIRGALGLGFGLADQQFHRSQPCGPEGLTGEVLLVIAAVLAALAQAGQALLTQLGQQHEQGGSCATKRAPLLMRGSGQARSASSSGEPGDAAQRAFQLLLVLVWAALSSLRWCSVSFW